MIRKFYQHVIIFLPEIPVKIIMLTCTIRGHGGTVVSTVASQPDGSGFDPAAPAGSPRVYMGFQPVL